MLLTPALVWLIAPGFEGEKRELTVALVRILFPGAGLLVLSAWCLGVLNSHRRFLLSYLAPVIWNVAMIATLLWWGAQAELPQLAMILAWGAVVGSALQLLVQLPAVLALVPDLRLRLEWSDDVRTTVRNFVPVFFSRGVVQVSAYIDQVLASLLPTGAVTGLANAQLLYTLPVSLFGLSVSAASLPAMSAAVGLDQAGALRDRVNRGLRQIAFFVVPSAVAFLMLGDVIAAALFQTGRFRYADAVFVWGILAGSSIGLLATTLARLYASTYYALRDTRTPLRYALVHVFVVTTLGYVAAVVLPPALGIDPLWGTAGLTASASVAGWIELALLKRTLDARIGSTGIPWSVTVKLWSAALGAGAVGWIVRLAAPAGHPIANAGLILLPFGASYFLWTFVAGIPEARALFDRLKSILSNRSKSPNPQSLIPSVSVLACQLTIALGLIEVGRRGRIRHIRCERDSLCPAQHLEQFSVLRIAIGKHALEDVGGDVIDDRFLQVQQRHLSNSAVAIGHAHRQIVGSSAQRETMVLLEPAISKQRLRAVPVKLHR